MSMSIKRAEDRAAGIFTDLLGPLANAEGVRLRLLKEPELARDLQVFLEKNKVSSCISKVLSEIEEALPQDWRAQLGFKRNRRAQQNRSRLQHLFPILEKFDDAGIRTVLFKGPHLAEQFYGGLEHRFYGDIDLLVEPRDVRRSEQILSSLGAKLKNPLPFGRFLTFRSIHAVDYLLPDLAIDLHWRVTDFDPHRVSALDTINRSVALKFEGRELTVPCNEDALVIELLQIYRDASRGVFQLKSICDAWQILAQPGNEFDWDRFFAARELQGTAVTCAGALGVVFSSLQNLESFGSLSAHLDHQLGAGWQTQTYYAASLPKHAMNHRKWARSVAGVSVLRYWGWWISSLPFRLAAYLPNEINKLRVSKANHKQVRR